MKVTRIDQKGIALITGSEGFKSAPYLCPAGVPTIGYGTTRYPNGVKVSLSDLPITKEKAMEYFLFDINRFEYDVDAYAVDTITQNQINALVSFTYNFGPTALKNSTLLKKVNKNPNDPTIRDEFNKWIFDDGMHNGKDDDGDGLIDEPGEMKKEKGLIDRRKAEADLYFTP